MQPPASRIQHAIRLLALMRWAGGLAGVPQNGSLAVRSALRQVLDSWLRNPDCWLVEVEGLQISLTGAEHKLRQMTQMLKRFSVPVTLGLPRRRHTELAEALR